MGTSPSFLEKVMKSWAPNPAARLVLAFRDDPLHTADHTAFQAHLDTVGMSSRAGQNLANDSFRQPPGTLVLFLHNLHPRPGFDVGSFSTFHPRSPRLIKRPVPLLYTNPTPVPVLFLRGLISRLRIPFQTRLPGYSPAPASAHRSPPRPVPTHPALPSPG